MVNCLQRMLCVEKKNMFFKEHVFCLYKNVSVLLIKIIIVITIKLHCFISFMS